MYIITHDELPLSYRIPQSAHAVAELAHKAPSQYNEWFHNHKTIISLSVSNAESLYSLSNTLTGQYSVFREPDLLHEITSICLIPVNKHDIAICKGLSLTKNEKASNYTKKRKLSREVQLDHSYDHHTDWLTDRANLINSLPDNLHNKISSLYFPNEVILK